MELDGLTPNGAILDELGRRLAALRKQRGLSQQALADEAGVGVATLRRIEDGSDSRLGSWLRILKALRLEAGYDGLVPEELRSPMADAGVRRRKGRADGTAFTWGDERP